MRKMILFITLILAGIGSSAQTHVYKYEIVNILDNMGLEKDLSKMKSTIRYFTFKNDFLYESDENGKYLDKNSSDILTRIVYRKKGINDDGFFVYCAWSYGGYSGSGQWSIYPFSLTYFVKPDKSVIIMDHGSYGEAINIKTTIYVKLN